MTLQQVQVNGQMLPAASSSAAITGISKIIGAAANSAAYGPHVYVLANSDVKFTLAAPQVAATNRPPSQQQQQVAPKPPPHWVLQPVQQEGVSTTYKASLAGTSQAGNANGMAALTIGCTESHFTGPAGNQASLSAELRVRASMIRFIVNGEYACEGDSDGSNAIVHANVAGKETLHGLCMDTTLPTNPNAPVSLQISYNAPHFQELLNASSGPFAIRINDGKTGDTLKASFTLPEDATQVHSAMDACLRLADQAYQKQQNAIVASCPDVEGKTLVDVDVLSGAAARPYKRDTENDIGTAWNLPKGTARQPRPKFTLSCSYVAVESAADEKQIVTERKTLSIPTTASFCVHRHDREDNHPFGRCETPEGTGY